jgi:flagellar biosynthesis protein FlhF
VNLRTYRAYTMAEALDAVKRDLGVDAAVLHTRSYKRGGVLGIGRKTVVEVTAATASEAGPLRTPPAGARGTRPNSGPPAKPTAASAARAYKPSATSSPKAAERAAAGVEVKRLDLLAAIEEHRKAVASNPETATASAKHPPAFPLDDALPSRHATMDSSRTPSRVAEPHTVTRSISPDRAVAADAAPASGSGTAAVAQRFILTAVEPPAKTTRKSSTGTPATPVDATDDSRAMQEEMQAIRSMVTQILEHQRQDRPRAAGGASRDWSAALTDLAVRLDAQELAPEIAHGLLTDVDRELGDAADDETRAAASLRRRIMGLIPTAEDTLSRQPDDGRPLTVALIGPTGVGKTTTLAKLAAAFKLKKARRVGLITCDTYRIAAVEQLRTYANIIGLPLKVVLSPDEMRQACRQLRDCDVILIDSAGRSQRDRDRIAELKGFVDAADPHEVHLVLSCTAGEKVLAQEVAAFSQARVDRVILSKLDEAVTFGGVINLLRRVGRPLSFVTTGQEVPDHIEQGRADRLADLLLGGAIRNSPADRADIKPLRELAIA